MEAQAAHGRFERFDAPALRATSVNAPLATEAMLRQLGATSEDFAYGSTALAVALRERRRAVIAASLSPAPRVSCWQCDHDEHGIALHPLALGDAHLDGFDAAAAQLVGGSTRGDVLVACDPLGEHELLCRALRLAARQGVTTIAITADQPNLLAALATHAVRVPAAHRDAVAAALAHFVQTAATSLVPLARRVTGPLRALDFV